jgi:hypothetical protein
MAFGLDYAWKPHPSHSAMKAKNVSFVVRYLSGGNSKDITKSEASSLSKAGFSICLVWETTASRASKGYAAGEYDAKKALAQAKSVGMPASRPIYFAVDYDANGSAVASYFRGAIAAIGKERVGVYAGYRVIDYLYRNKLAKYFWQTLAWSGGKWHSANHIEQYRVEVMVDGADCDYNRTKKADFGQWKVGSAPPVGFEPFTYWPASGKPFGLGTRGDWVKSVQELLKRKGY